MICSEGKIGGGSLSAGLVLLGGTCGQKPAPSSILWHSRPGPESRGSCFSRMFQTVSDTQEESSVKARMGSIDNRRGSRSLNARQQRFTQNERRGELGYTNYILVIKY